MTLEEFKKKYGTESVEFIINELLYRIRTKTELTPAGLLIVDELKADLRELLK